MSSDPVGSWRDAQAPAFIDLIEKAKRQLVADELYEYEQPTTAESIRKLGDAALHASKVGEELRSFSPIAVAAMREVSPAIYSARGWPRLRRSDRMVIGRADVADWIELLERVSDIANDASRFLAAQHTPLGDTGRGSGSSMSRESDLRAVAYVNPTVPFRSPKDKFAVRVIEAVAECCVIVDQVDLVALMRARGMRRKMQVLLDDIWREMDRSPANWSRVLASRADIARHIGARKARSAEFARNVKRHAT